MHYFQTILQLFCLFSVKHRCIYGSFGNINQEMFGFFFAKCYSAYHLAKNEKISRRMPRRSLKT